MNWRDRLSVLPVTMPKPEAFSDEEGFVDEVYGAKLMATHTYYPGAGAQYSITISGPREGAQQLVQELQAELGKASLIQTLPSGVVLYLWPSGSTTIPDSPVHKRLGRDRITTLCHECGLSPEEQLLIDELLVALAYYDLINDLEGRVQFVSAKLGGLAPERRQPVLMALLNINTKFALLKDAN